MFGLLRIENWVLHDVSLGLFLDEVDSTWSPARDIPLIVSSEAMVMA